MMRVMAVRHVDLSLHAAETKKKSLISVAAVPKNVCHRRKRFWSEVYVQMFSEDACRMLLVYPLFALVWTWLKESSQIFCVGGTEIQV
jgi:hypothetical protein